MTNQEMKDRLLAVLSSLDAMSKSGNMRVTSLSGIQTMAGCISVISEVADSLGSRSQQEEKIDE